jgi:methyltransferase (TIGR00027 family)
MPGIWATMLCRKRYVGDKVLQAVEEGAEAVVVLGAGMDTLAHRLPALARIPVYEVDVPENVERKRSRLHEVFGAVPGHVTLVPLDFETGDLFGALERAGLRPDRRAVFVWEGVTQYLTGAGVRRTLAALAAAPSGSRLVFTHVRRDFLEGRVLYGAGAAHRDFVRKRRLWTFGLDPEEVPGLLAPYGWRQVEQAGPREFTARYLRPRGRPLPVSEVERAVYAERT